MSDTINNDGGPAFPVNGPNGDFPGMSLRDWFAGQALAGIISRLGVLSYTPRIDMLQQHNEVNDAGEDNEDSDMMHYGTAYTAYEIADAMLAARKVVRSEDQ